MKWPQILGPCRLDTSRRLTSIASVSLEAASVKCVRRLGILPTLAGVGVVLLMADGKGRDAVSGEIKGMQIKDERAVAAGAEPWQNGSRKVDSQCRLWVTCRFRPV